MDKPMFCRCCLTTNDLQSVFTSCDIPGKVLVYADMIKRCFFLEIWSRGDNDPFICSPCIQRLQDAYQFRAQIQSIQHMLSNAAVILLVDDRIVIQKTEPMEDIEIKYDPGSLTDLNEEPSMDSTVQTEPTERTQLISSDQNDSRIAIKVDRQTETNLTDLKSIKNQQPTARGHNIPTTNSILNKKITQKICKKKPKISHKTDARNDRQPEMYKHLVKQNDNMYPCRICGKKKTSQKILDSHMATHSVRECRFACPQCSERFMTYYQRQKHLGEIHNVDIYTYKCDSCDLAFCVSGKLSCHIRDVHMKLKPHACTECPSAFYSKHCLKNHMLTHTGVRNYKCEVCNKSYTRQSTLNEHMRIHNNDKRFTCHECGRSFTQKCTLNGHLKSHSKGKS